MSTYKKISSLNQNMNPSFKTKIDFAKHSNLYLNYSHPKRNNNPQLSKSSNRSSSAKSKIYNHPIKQNSLSHPKNQNKNFMFIKAPSKLTRKEISVKTSHSSSVKTTSLNNSYFKPPSVNDSIPSGKNLNITASARKKNMNRAKTPNMKKLNSSKMNVSKLNLSSLSMGASPNIRKININVNSMNNINKDQSPFRREIINSNHNKNVKKFFASKNIFKSMTLKRRGTSMIITHEENIKMNKSKHIIVNNNTTSTNNTTNNINSKTTSNSIQTSNSFNNNITPIVNNNTSNNKNTSIVEEESNMQIMNKIQQKSQSLNKPNENSTPSDSSKVIKTIRCMHDLSKTGMSGEDKKYNQDRCFIYPNFNNSKDNIYMGVCDGHGYYGHEVSGYIWENLPSDLNHIFKNHKVNMQTDKYHNLISQCFLTENSNLLSNKMIDTNLSGSTCVSVIYTPEKLIIANIGDSRCVLGKQHPYGKWEAEDLSRDHKPSLPEEAERIRKKGGRIRPMRDDDGSFIGPLRVYMRDKEMPGLAMTRSFGDYFASTAGTISEPEITEHVFAKEDKFMVLASDGLYEFISSQEVVEIVARYYLKDDIVACCEYLYKESCRRWLEEEEDTIDDITIILVFFNED